MSQPTGLERFSGRNFLLERSLLAARQLVVELLKNTSSFAIRVCIFGGLLGVMWTLSNLQPQGDLAQYLTPFLLLSFPIVLLGPQEKTWQRLVNLFILLCFWGVWCWAAVWYFRFPNYQFIWLFVSLLLLSVLTWVTLRKRRSRRRDSAITQTLQLVIWMGGLGLILLLMSFLVYFIAYQLAPEPGTANILAGGTFLFFLTLTILRVFLLDSMRYRRADRMEHVQPDDAFLFLEWMIPRSYSFLVILGLLLVAEAMMFSTIYHTFRRPTARLYAPIQVAGSPNSGSPWFMAATAPLELVAQKGNTASHRSKLPLRPNDLTTKIGKKAVSRRGVHRTVGLMEWVLFAFKPYVFPKHEGREVDAPQWFKYLGRALLGLIIAILLTQQLTIWKQFYNLYLTLVGIVRRERHEGENPELTRQKEEALAHMGSMLNTHASPWRRQIFYACTVPSQWIGWMLILDPSTAFWEGLGRAQRAIVERWDVALLTTGMLLLAICAPFSIIYKMGWLPLLYAALPSLAFGVLLFSLRFILYLRPPKLYQFWIWWLLLVHLIFSLVLFFLTLSLGKQTGFWHYLLWYGSLVSILVFPAVYIFGGERHRRVQSLTERVDVNHDDSDVTVRRLILTTFFPNQHRRWLLSALTSRIHPVRGSGIKMRLILPSLIIGALDVFRVSVESLESFIKRTLSSLARSLFLWMVIQVVVLGLVFLSHLLTIRQFFSSEILESYTITLFCLVGPGLMTAVVMLVMWLFKRRQGPVFEQDIHPRLYLGLMSGLSVISAMTWMLLHRPFSLWQWSGYSLLAFILCSPWVGLLSVRYRLRKKAQQARRESGEDDTSAFKERTFNVLERLALWLGRAESEFLNNLYRRSTSWRRTEVSMRDTMIVGCAAMLEESQKALISGTWYDEEEHAIKRVYLQWLTDEATGHERTELAEELAYLTEQVLDTLSSLVYDLEHTNRFDRIQHTPDLDLLLDTLERVLRLPRSFETHKPEQWQYQEQLLSCLEAIHALMLKLNAKWQKDPARLSQRLKIFRILGALRLEKSQESLRTFLQEESDSELRHGLLKALGGARENIEYLEEIRQQGSPEELETYTVTDSLLCLKLPSPLAFLYRSYRAYRKGYTQQQEFLAKTQLRQTQPSGLLEELQIPDVLCEARLRLAAEEQEKQLRLRHCQHIRTTYFSLFGYLLVALKDCWTEAPDEIQEMGWENPSALVRSLARLHTLDFPEGRAMELKELLQSLYDPERAQFVENSCQAGQNVESCQSILESTYAQALDSLTLFPIPSWKIPNLHIESDGKYLQADDADTSTNVFEVRFQGGWPQIVSSTQEEEATPQSSMPIGRGFLLLGTQPRPHLEFYISLWFLQLLHELAHSDGLLQAELATLEDGETTQDLARNRRLEQVEELTNRFGRLLTPYSPEQQRVLERLFDSIGRRLNLLKNLSMEELHSIEGKGIVDFVSTLEKLTKFLDNQEVRVLGRLNNLLYLNLLPSQEFIYLLKSKMTKQGELRWYLNPLTQQTSVQLYGIGEELSPVMQPLPAAGSVTTQPSSFELPQVTVEGTV
jgi:hypothetical protein